MSKYYRNRPLEVGCTDGGVPEEIRDGNCVWKVDKALDCWRDTGRWWEGESEKAFFRLLLAEGGIKEVFRDLDDGSWFLYKSYD